MDTKQSRYLLRLVLVIAQVIADCGTDGVPRATLYAALMFHGPTVEDFEELLQAMQTLELIRKEPRGDWYFITEKGRQLAAATKSTAQADSSAG